MKRSEINAIIRDIEAFLLRLNVCLPPFASWSVPQWRQKGPEVREIVDRQLGWDITDFGSGRFRTCGLVLFTLRNGTVADLKTGGGKLYAEKILIADVGQVTPMHFHWSKTEDIINRGGGDLALRLYQSTADEQLADREVTVSLDGVVRRVPAGGMVTLRPGESITLPARLYHTFWGVGQRVLVGEVSTVNDDRVDNRFFEPVGRFPTIDEDEEPLHLLTADYATYYRPSRRPARRPKAAR